jgi:hypothetical protein
MGLLELFRRRLGLQILPGRLAIDPSFHGTQLHVMGAGKLPSEPPALLFSDHLAASLKTNGQSPIVWLGRTNQKPLTQSGEF